ncbi:hypothetical protein [Neobacillus sp. 19]|uniref:hypothetical protein n=1 Tax=Neobacillus sp. 19 TaxID=3394458 RepID=UPI003BF64657
MLKSDKHEVTFKHVNYSDDGIHKQTLQNPFLKEPLPFSRAFGSVKDDITQIMQWASIA